ncbi:unnamed protein product [Rhizoctonia solani]|uniref:Uncharacterized protein n=1 Tax=Rhizoctonia solani TaxID=456999 RepID=A0A8H3GBE5_9AGAM|nr:unnamed protein product [Rhizoctonia solani]
MSGAVEGPFAPTNSFLAPAPTSGMASSRPPLSSRPVKPATSSEVVDLRLELNTPRISVEMGSRLLVSYIELLLYLKGQVPFPPSQLRRMVAGGRKGSPHQNKATPQVFKHAIGGPPLNTIVVRTFNHHNHCCRTELEQITVDGDATELEDQPPEQENRHDMASSSNENLKFNTVPVRRRGSPRLPLQELSPVETLSSQLSSVSLRPSVDEAMIRQAERALSQIMACSEIEFKGDLQPMGAQIFMRAPRRFKHESWAVRPEAARMLDAPFKALNELDVPIVETVRVCAKDAPTTVDEVEEMIWWGWDGRLAGYA